MTKEQLEQSLQDFVKEIRMHEDNAKRAEGAVLATQMFLKKMEEETKEEPKPRKRRSSKKD